MKVGNGGGYTPGPWTTATALGTMGDGVVEGCRLGIGESFQHSAAGVEVGGAVVHGVGTLVAGYGAIYSAANGSKQTGPAILGTAGELSKTTGYVLQACGFSPLVGLACIGAGSVLSAVGAVGADANS